MQPTGGRRRGARGRAERLLPTNRPTVEAAFPRESYSPGNLARLVFWTGGSQVSLTIFRAGTEDGAVRTQDVMLGTAVTATRRLGAVGPGRAVRIRIGEWPSGLYFARLVARGGKVGYAPFVLRPRILGESHVAVVLSTMTWQAYNFHDDDRNGTLDTWYAGQPHARLGRPYENRGVIPHYKHYEQPFLRWLVSTSRNVDYLADADLDAPSTTGRGLAEAYDLIVFPGHHEYVTRHEFEVVTGFRNHGGSLMFLSANNFFYRTVKHGNVMTRTGRWRLAGRPEAALIGVQYFGNDAGRHQAPWTIRASSAGKWIFAGTDLQPGSSFARGGIEADATAPSSPRGTQVIATIPNIFRYRAGRRDVVLRVAERREGVRRRCVHPRGKGWDGRRQTGARESVGPTRRRRGRTGACWQRQLPRLTLAGCLSSYDPCAFESSF